MLDSHTHKLDFAPNLLGQFIITCSGERYICTQGKTRNLAVRIVICCQFHSVLRHELSNYRNFKSESISAIFYLHSCTVFFFKSVGNNRYVEVCVEFKEYILSANAKCSKFLPYRIKITVEYIKNWLILIILINKKIRNWMTTAIGLPPSCE